MKTQTTMKTLFAALGCFSALACAFADDGPKSKAPPLSTIPSQHRYLVERTFPARALDGLDSATKAKVNAVNSKFGVHWVVSYANAQKTKTYCVYEGPSEAAIRKAAAANALPVDSITEVPVTLDPK
jgi:hypothetical protein